LLIPDSGIAVFLLDTTNPIAVYSIDEFVLGRAIEGSIDEIVDLTPYGAFSNGVSRRHAMIRRRKTGYEIIDLDSTNGTWLNEKRLTPTKAYALPNGSTIRLGQLRLQVLVKE
jgi:pSer/pThr/pTyr-binding forkhead associated (FHA) protein